MIPRRYLAYIYFVGLCHLSDHEESLHFLRPFLVVKLMIMSRLLRARYSFLLHRISPTIITPSHGYYGTKSIGIKLFLPDAGAEGIVPG